jgi:hypothetical protein
MTGYIPVDIPTKKYIKAYIQHKLGEKPFLTTDTTIGAKLYDVLQHKTNERKTEFSNARYNTRLRIYISRYVYVTRGAFLNETNIKNFNIFVEAELKARFRDKMDFYISFLPSFEANLPEVRRIIGIDIESWSDDSIRKDYYRYRRKAGLPPLYSKNIYSRTVPSSPWY